MRAVNARALAYPAQRRIAEKEIMGPHCGQHSTAYSTGWLLMSHLGSAPGVRGRARAAARGTPAYGAFSWTPWRKCGGAARSTSPHLQRRAYAAWWVGAKVAPIESFVIRFSVPSQQLCCHPSCTWQLVRLCCPGLFFTYESVFVEERFVTGTYVV
jgi:hypothetical protein